jgi:catechol 2,3-dioxygenase-like lactoylglutathione lyase family enzyme
MVLRRIRTWPVTPLVAPRQDASERRRGLRSTASVQPSIVGRKGEPVPVAAIEHVQLAMPPGREQAARDFYQGILGIPEVPKPAHLASRGGAWFERGALKIHLGVETDFRPARKAHPALLVIDLPELVARLKAHNMQVIDDDPLPGYFRVYIADPFGNRIELMERRTGD